LQLELDAVLLRLFASQPSGHRLPPASCQTQGNSRGSIAGSRPGPQAITTITTIATVATKDQDPGPAEVTVPQKGGLRAVGRLDTKKIKGQGQRPRQGLYRGQTQR